MDGSGRYNVSAFVRPVVSFPANIKLSEFGGTESNPRTLLITGHN